MPETSEDGVVGIETAAMYAAVSSALKRSGGKRSFSISDFRLFMYSSAKGIITLREVTYASSKPVMASFIP